MKFTKQDLERSIRLLSMCRYFPADIGTRAAVAELLTEICPDKEALTWLIQEYVNRIGEWKGPVELRGVLCTRFRPADGIEANSAIPGYTPEDGEARSYEKHLQIKAQERVGGWIEGGVSTALPGGSRKLLEAMGDHGMPEDKPE